MYLVRAVLMRLFLCSVDVLRISPVFILKKDFNPAFVHVYPDKTESKFLNCSKKYK